MSGEKKLTGYPSIDKPWLKYYTEQDLKIEVPQCTIYQNIYERNKDHLRDIAISYYGNSISYKMLFNKVQQCTKTLYQLGVKQGDCVNMCTAGIPEAIYIVLACSRIGAIANFINPLFTTQQKVDRINDTGAEWMLILDEMYSYIEKALPETCTKNVVIIPATNSLSIVLSKPLYLKSEARKILKEQKRGDQKYFSWREFIQIGTHYSGAIDDRYEKDAPAVMVYSSGTTGASKGILLTNDGINATIANYSVQSMHFQRGDSFLQMIPVWFSTGIVYSVIMPLAKGFNVILEPRFSKESFLRDLRKYKPIITLTATSLWLYVINSGTDIDLSNMKYPITGGEKIIPQDDVAINEYFKRNGCKKKFYKGYGMCELGSEISGTTDAPNYLDKQGGCGYPILNVTVSAFDIVTGKELPYGQHGELRVISPARMKGYYKNPEATANFFKEDEAGNIWGCTGDIGYVDEDGEVFVLGRATDHYRRDNGDIVFLFDIEEEILKNHAISQCKVVDIDDNGNQKLVAHLVFQDGVEKRAEVIASIWDSLRKTLPSYEVPEYYKIRKSMPVHTNGKRDVGALKQDRENLVAL